MRLYFKFKSYFFLQKHLVLLLLLFWDHFICCFIFFLCAGYQIANNLNTILIRVTYRYIDTKFKRNSALEYHPHVLFHKSKYINVQSHALHINYYKLLKIILYEMNIVYLTLFIRSSFHTSVHCECVAIWVLIPGRKLTRCVICFLQISHWSQSIQYSITRLSYKYLPRKSCISISCLFPIL